MNWQAGTPSGKGLYLCRTTEGFGGSEVGYNVLYFNGYFKLGLGQKVTHWCVITEPVKNESGTYRDPLNRIQCKVQTYDRRVELNNIGPGVEP
jgi:hypothetical protein